MQELPLVLDLFFFNDTAPPEIYPLSLPDALPILPYPARGAKVEIRPTTILPGGQTATAVVACQQWGLRTRYVGKVGGDSAAALHAAEFSRLGVEAHLLTAPDCPSQQAFILIDDSGERTVLWRRDHRLALRPEELQRDRKSTRLNSSHSQI